MAGLFPGRKSSKSSRSIRRRRDTLRRTAKSPRAMRSVMEFLETRALLALSVIETDASWKVSAADPGSGQPRGTIWPFAHHQPRWRRQASLSSYSMITPR